MSFSDPTKRRHFCFLTGTLIIDLARGCFCYGHSAQSLGRGKALFCSGEGQSECLNFEVIAYEIRRKCVIGKDAANLRCR